MLAVIIEELLFVKFKVKMELLPLAKHWRLFACQTRESIGKAVNFGATHK